MRTGNLLFSAAHFVFITALFLLGGACIALQHFSYFRVLIVTLINDQAMNFSSLGYAILLLGLILCGCLYLMYRGVYLQVQTGCGMITIKPELIQTLVQNYWDTRFPEKNLKIEVVLGRCKQIEVIAQMPEGELESSTAIEQELGSLFSSQLGYHRQWAMTLILK